MTLRTISITRGSAFLDFKALRRPAWMMLALFVIDLSANSYFGLLNWSQAGALALLTMIGLFLAIPVSILMVDKFGVWKRIAISMFAVPLTITGIVALKVRTDTIQGNPYFAIASALVVSHFERTCKPLDRTIVSSLRSSTPFGCQLAHRQYADGDYYLTTVLGLRSASNMTNCPLYSNSPEKTLQIKKGENYVGMFYLCDNYVIVYVAFQYYFGYFG